MRITWGYIEGTSNNRKHAFYNPAKQIPICGVSLYKEGSYWSFNSKPLRAKIKCRACKHLLG